ncbi:hypothetical protein [Lewinella sp. W8]|uniref:hypothetical protein n=1 Tax=Lewinella sp. W8 TaxID=2528208 RepID=UPI0010671EC6|nr:hypothetical protein [Lewinella sp. W8]MTB51155.1 hypothetical protein [Lewinella sp. W8]
MGTVVTSRSRWLTYLGSGLLVIMALFHGSGLGYVSGLMASSNAPDFLKDIFGPLFAHASFHLLSLAAFGILSLFLGEGRKKVLQLLAVLIFLDAILGFYLGGIIPGGLLSLAAGIFLLASRKAGTGS